jgi:hypothetical protein
MSTDFLKPFERTFSKQRLAAYRILGESDEVLLRRCLWNTSLCEALFSPLQLLEVGFRNAVHLEFGNYSGCPDWLTQGKILEQSELNSVADARLNLLKRGQSPNEGLLVGELSFGFWTTLLDKRYYLVWHKTIANVFPSMPRGIRTHTKASGFLHGIRKLRNAALHHHSIWHWSDLAHRHGEIHTVARWICPALAALIKEVDRFPAVHAAGYSFSAPIVNAIIGPKVDSTSPGSHVKFITASSNEKPV